MADNTFSKKYEKELQGQVEFLQKYLPRIDKSLDITDVQRDFSDGVVRGNLLEFKTMIDNLNVVLSQAIKYLSSMRVKGRPIPANIILISLNNTTAYIYHSDDYLEQIEKIYYSEDGNSWVEDTENLKIAAIKIQLKDNRLSANNSIDLKCKLGIPAELGVNKSTCSNLVLSYTYAGEIYTTNSAIVLKTEENNINNENSIEEITNSCVAGTEYVFDYNGTDGTTGSVQEFVAPYSGTYKLETWGASGGNQGSVLGGRGGYSTGTITLSANTSLFIACQFTVLIFSLNAPCSLSIFNFSSI